MNILSGIRSRFYLLSNVIKSDVLHVDIACRSRVMVMSKIEGVISKFYAVKRGRSPGIYTTWTDCEAQVKGFSRPSFKKFDSREAAIAFINGSASKPSFSQNTIVKSEIPVSDMASSLESTVAALKTSMETMQKTMTEFSQQLHEMKNSVAQLQENSIIPPGSKRSFSTSSKDNGEPKQPKLDTSLESVTGDGFDEANCTHVYTDGGCFFNGKDGARAGIGVFWGEDSPLNVSERLPGKQTNNRAEILAAARAVELAKKQGIQNLVLHTDSQFVINAITKWIKGWKKKDWKLATGGPVKNKEDFQELDSKLEGINVKWVYVKGHDGDAGNEAVDRLAKLGAKKKLDSE